MLDFDDLTTEALCRYMLNRNSATISVQKPEFALRKLTVITSAALELSNRKGFQAMSLRDLSHASGVSMGGLYAYFDSKTTLVNMILSEVTAATQRVLSNPPDTVRGDPVAHLKWLISTHVRMTEEMQPWFTFAFMEAKNFPGGAAQGHRQRGIDRRIFPGGARGWHGRERVTGRYLAIAGRADQAALARLVCETRQVSPPQRDDRHLYFHRAGFCPVRLSGRTIRDTCDRHQILNVAPVTRSLPSRQDEGRNARQHSPVGAGRASDAWNRVPARSHHPAHHRSDSKRLPKVLHATLTTILPKFRPARRSLNAAGAASSPSTTCSL